MRTIKLKFWDNEDKKWLTDFGEYLSKGYTKTEEEPDVLEIFSSDNSFAICQFTGLLDKNGKEIYEGDIIELEHWEPQRYEVVFNRGGFCMKFGEDSNFYPDIKYTEDSIIIGNIYQSPDLLTNN